MVLPVGQAPLPDPVGVFSDRAEETYVSALVNRVSAALGARPREDVARVNLLLQTPGGSIYSLYIDDGGVPRTALVHGP